MKKTLPERLCKNTIFEGLTSDQIRDILPCVVDSIHEYHKEECLLDRGQTVEHLGVVLDGDLQVRDGSGTIASIPENGLLGEADLFSSIRAAAHRVVAINDARVAFLSREFFLHTCGKECPTRDAHQIVMKNMLRLLSDRALLLNRKVAFLTTPGLRSKIAMYLWELYESAGAASFVMPLNREQLADYFSVARPSLSRELAELRNQGVINFQRSKVTVLDSDTLYNLAQGGDNRM